MSLRQQTILRIVAGSAILAAALTAFYFVHEDLPKFLRAPTSLILAPIAMVDGICYAMGASGIYGKPVPVFVINWIVCAIVCAAIVALKRHWSRKAHPPVRNRD